MQGNVSEQARALTILSECYEIIRNMWECWRIRSALLVLTTNSRIRNSAESQLQSDYSNRGRVILYFPYPVRRTVLIRTGNVPRIFKPNNVFWSCCRGHTNLAI